MSSRRFFGPDPASSRLRAILSRLDRDVELACATELDDALRASLRAEVTALTEHLALGPEPEMRACPSCRTWGMRDASICGNCWLRLPPLAPIASA